MLSDKTNTGVKRHNDSDVAAGNAGCMAYSFPARMVHKVVYRLYVLCWPPAEVLRNRPGEV